jgi:hypothetical protein
MGVVDSIALMRMFHMQLQKHMNALFVRQDEELRRVLCSLATVMGRVPPSAPERAESAAGGPALQDATGALPLPCVLACAPLLSSCVSQAACRAPHALGTAKGLAWWLGLVHVTDTRTEQGVVPVQEAFAVTGWPE